MAVDFLVSNSVRPDSQKDLAKVLRAWGGGGGLNGNQEKSAKEERREWEMYSAWLVAADLTTSPEETESKF